MADFNFDASVNAQDQTSASRGYTSSKVALANLFEGIGNTAMTAVKVADQNNVQNQTQKVEEGVANILNDFGFRTEGNDSTGSPAELQGYAKQLNNLHKAYTSGALKESNFQIRVDAMSRKIRAQYPGYDAEIDGIISQTLNRSTANDLRKTLMQEWDQDAQAAGDDEKKYQAELADWREKGLYTEFPDFEKRAAEGNPYSKEEVRLKMGKRLSREHAIDIQNNELELDEKLGKANKQKTVDYAYNDASLVAQDILRASTNDTSIKQVLETIQSKPAKDWTDEERSTILNSYAQLEAKATAQIMERLNKPVYNRMTKEERDDVMKRALEPIAVIKEALTNKDFGAINIFKTLLDEQTNRDAAKYMGINGNGNEAMSEVARRLKVAETVFGPETKLLMQQNPKYQESQLTAIDNLMGLDLATKKPLDEIVQEGLKAGGPAAKTEAGALTRSVVQKGINILNNPTTPQEGVEAVVESFFGEGNADFFSKFSNKTNRPDGRSERMMLFEKMMSPEVTKRILEASKNNPDLAGKYKDAMGTAFNSLFSEDIANLVNAKMYSDWVNFNFNPKTLQFEAVEKKELNAAQKFFPSNELWKMNDGKKSMDRLNRYVLQLKPAMDGLGLDTHEALIELFMANGAIGSAPQGSLWHQLGAALERGLETKTPSGSPKTGGSYGDLSTTDNIFNEASKGDPKRQKLLNFIGIAEGADYDTMYGGAKMPLTKMTIDEASMMADYNRAKGGENFSTAIGKYQIIQETLRRAMKGAGLTGDDLFSAENQDKLANWIIDNEGGGGKDPKKLSAIWASLPKDASGTGAYDGVGDNKARVSWEELQATLQ